MTREEAIKQVREVLENLKSNLNGQALEKCASQAFETLIPELKESNGERIIKKLQDYVKNRNWMLNGPTQAEVLAWLEKQKNLISYYEEKLDRCACENLDKGIKEVLNHPEEYGLEKQKEQKHPDGCFTCDEYNKGYEEGRRNGFTAGYNKAMKEVEQKEQKSVKCELEDAFKYYTDAGIIVSCGDIVAKPKERH